MDSPLHIPSAKKWKGMTVSCNKCKADVTDICKETGKALQRCPFGNRHTFKIYVHMPGTRNTRKTKTLKTRDIDEAIKQAIEFEKEVKANTNPSTKKPEIKVEKVKEAEAKPDLLINALARYVGWLHNEGVPGHRKKVRSKEHIKDTELALAVFAECLKESGYDFSSFGVDDINDNIVGKVHDFLLQEKKFANRTFNKYLSYYTSFMKWYGEEYNSPVRNWFESVPRKTINPKPETISKEEFELLLNRISLENGIKEYESGQKHFRNVYRPWLKDGLRLALETGRRREEVINLKFNNIINDNSNHSFIKVEDFKINRAQGRTNDSEKKYIYIPVTNSLQQLLNELGFEKYKDSENFILAPDVQIKRNKIMSDVLSRGFSHFYDQLNTGKKLTFKSLRKTYITNLSIYMGGNAKAITGHSDDAVIEKHYLNKQAIASAAKGFSVFSNEIKNKNELQQIRNTNNQKNKEVKNEKEKSTKGVLERS